MPQHSRCYRDGVLVDEGFSLATVSEHLASGGIVWVDLCPPDPDALQVVAEELGLHTLAVDDAIRGRQRPKFSRYDGHDFLAVYAVRLDVASGQLVTSEVAAFVSPTALVTVRKDDGLGIEELLRRWDDNVALTAYGVGALVHGLLDHVVDTHFDTVQSLDDEIEELEDLLFDERPHDRDVQRRSFELRKSLVRLRRVVLPMREVLNTLMRRDVGLASRELTPYYQDVYDHVLRATEWTESLRDLVATIVETNLTLQGNRLNVITKKVTSWAAIIAVPTGSPGSTARTCPIPASPSTPASSPPPPSSSASPAASSSPSGARTGCEPRRVVADVSGSRVRRRGPAGRPRRRGRPRRSARSGRPPGW